MSISWFYTSYKRRNDTSTQIGLLSNVLLRFAGDSPYPGKKPHEVANLLQTGYRMPRPKHLSKDL